MSVKIEALQQYCQKTIELDMEALEVINELIDARIRELVGLTQTDLKTGLFRPKVMRDDDNVFLFKLVRTNPGDPTSVERRAFYMCEPIVWGRPFRHHCSSLALDLHLPSEGKYMRDDFIVSTFCARRGDIRLSFAYQDARPAERALHNKYSYNGPYPIAVLEGPGRIIEDQQLGPGFFTAFLSEVFRWDSNAMHEPDVFSLLYGESFDLVELMGNYFAKKGKRPIVEGAFEDAEIYVYSDYGPCRRLLKKYSRNEAIGILTNDLFSEPALLIKKLARLLR